MANQDVINYAISWAVGIANDDSHGYDQTNRWGPDYDCSSLVIQAFENAGCPVKSAGASYTGNMVSVFSNLGFIDVTSQVNFSNGSGLIAGDVLWVDGHTEIFIGNGQVCGARINENGTTTGGQTGDQTGREIRVGAYYNYPWTIVLRLPSNGSPDNPNPDVPTPGPLPDTKTKKKKKYPWLLMKRNINQRRY